MAHNMPNLPGQVGLVRELRGRICDLSGDYLDMIAVALTRKEDHLARRRNKARKAREYELQQRANELQLLRSR